MKQSNEITGESVRHGSSSSSILVPPRDYDVSGNSLREDEESQLPTNRLVVIWRSVVAFWKAITGYLYQSTVNFVATFVADVISHPRLQIVLVDTIVTAINAFMDQDDIGDKFDDTARRVIYDTEKAREASHALGKEVVPVVTGFINGMAASLKPSEFKKRKTKREKRESSRQLLSDRGNAESDEDFDEDEDAQSHRKRLHSLSKKSK